MDNKKPLQHLIIAGNALCAQLDAEDATGESAKHAIETWELVVKSVRKSIPKPRTVWVKAAQNG